MRIVGIHPRFEPDTSLIQARNTAAWEIWLGNFIYLEISCENLDRRTGYYADNWTAEVSILLRLYLNDSTFDPNSYK
jgi:hypothetical protein